MAKFPRISLSPQERERILHEFALALSEIHDSQEAAEFIRDLLSQQEIEMLARRVRIAEFLLAGLTYQEIQNRMKVSQTTVARVGEWLKRSGDGYRIIVNRLKKKRGKDTPIKESSEWSKLKRRYPMMFWPQLVLDEIIASANNQQKKRLRGVLQEMDEKSDLYKKLNKLLS